MYKRRADRDDCEELTVTQIDALMDVYEALESADNLNSIVLSDLKVFFKVSIAGFDNLAREYKRGEVRDILDWIVTEPDVTEFFRDEDDDYETLETLLQRLRPYEYASYTEDKTTLTDVFTVGIDSKKTILEVATEAENEDAIEWLMEYFFKKHKDCVVHTGDELSLPCWRAICNIGNKFDDDTNREILLEIPPFEDYVSEIMKKGINGVIATSTPPNNNWCRTGSTHNDCLKPHNGQNAGSEINRILRDIEDVMEQPYDYIIPKSKDNESNATWVWCGGEWVRALCGGLLESTAHETRGRCVDTSP